AMKTYDLRATCGGRPLRVLGVGAVFTPPELRRRGYAATMLRAAMDQSASAGAQAAVLFSDISVRYYERLGLRVVASRECTGDAARDRVLSGLRDCLHRAGRTRLRLWPAGQLRELFDAPDRHTAIAMLAPLGGAASLPERGGPTDLALLDHI